MSSRPGSEYENYQASSFSVAKHSYHESIRSHRFVSYLPSSGDRLPLRIPL